MSGVQHIVVVHREAPDGGVDVFAPRCQGQFAQERPYCQGCDHTVPIGPSLCRCVIDVGADVQQWCHPWGKNKDLHEERSQIQVVDCHVSCWVGETHQTCLGCSGKGGVPEKILALGIPADPPPCLCRRHWLIQSKWGKKAPALLNLLAFYPGY